MSYILDALRRAQAERGRGSVPGLHTPTSPVAVPTVQRAAPARGLPWMVLAALAGVGAAAGAWWLVRAPSATVAAVVPAPAPAIPAPAAPASAAPIAVPAHGAAPAPETAPATTPTPTPTPTPGTTPTPTPAPARAPASASAPASKPTPERSARAEAPALRPERSAPAPAAPARAPAPRAAPPAPAPQESTGTVFALADLPASVREQLPTLQLAGVTYSSNPVYRMVIVNGQVLHEGDTAAPGLVLERIEPARTVWAFRGYRYALPTQ